MADPKGASTTLPQVRSPQPMATKSSCPLAGPLKTKARRQSLYLLDAEKYQRAHVMQQQLDQHVRRLQILADGKHYNTGKQSWTK